MHLTGICHREREVQLSESQEQANRIPEKHFGEEGRLEKETAVLKEGNLEVCWTFTSSAATSQQKPPTLELRPQQGWCISQERREDQERSEPAAFPEREQVKGNRDKMDVEIEEGWPLALLGQVLL